MPHIPNHPSAAKRHRQSLRRRDRNRAVKTRVRTTIKQAVEAMSGTDRAPAETKLREAVSALAKARSAGALHRNAVSRKVARLSARFHRVFTAQQPPESQPQSENINS